MKPIQNLYIAMCMVSCILIILFWDYTCTFQKVLYGHNYLEFMNMCMSNSSRIWVSIHIASVKLVSSVGHQPIHHIHNIMCRRSLASGSEAQVHTVIPDHCRGVYCSV